MIFKNISHKSLNLLALAVCLFQLTSASKILVLLPMSTKSMANIFEPLTLELSERGHHLTIVSPVTFKSIPKSNPNVTQLVPFDYNELVKDYPNPYEIRRQSKLYTLQLDWTTKYCQKLFDLPEIINLQNTKFDLILVNIIFQDCFAGIIHKIGSPIILVGSLPIPSAMLETFGTHVPSSFIPVYTLWDFSAQLTFQQRVRNFVHNTYIKLLVDRWTRPYLETIYRNRLGDQSLPSVDQVWKKQTSLVLMNSHFSITNPRPNLPNIVEIGGIHCKPAKDLPHDLKKWADDAKNGFIFFSMGSIVKTSQMPEEARKEFAKAFGKLKEKVIWKWESEEGMPDLPNNVKLVKWLPQQDLLGHPNIKLFITHGGLLSTEEAVYHGVPVLGMPIFIDQDANMRQSEILGFGVKGEILDLTEAKLTPLIRKILDNPKYMQKAKELSTLFRDQPESPLKRAVYWTEYVLRHNGAHHLKSPAMNLNLLQYHCIDVVVFLTLVVISTIFLVYYLIKLVFIYISWLCLGKASKTTQIQVTSRKQGFSHKKKWY